jgi:hypothetical protein
MRSISAKYGGLRREADLLLCFKAYQRIVRDVKMDASIKKGMVWLESE